jgi:hypothetical protein
MKLFFWTPGLDHLHLHTWSAIQSKLDWQITYVLTEPENHTRKRQGWKAVDLSLLDVLMLNDKDWLRQSLNIIRRDPEALHVFMGFWTDRHLFPLMVYAVNQGIKTAVISEQYSTSPVGYTEDEKYFIAKSKVILRPFLYRFSALILKLASNKKKLLVFFRFPLKLKSNILRLGLIIRPYSHSVILCPK